MECRSSSLIIFIIVLIIIVYDVEASFKQRKQFTSERIKEEPKDEGVLGTIKNSFKMAGNFFGLDAASGVANLVAEAFGESKTSSADKSSNEQESWGKTLLSGLMRTLSLDSGKISAIVLNAIIFLAQLLTTSLVPNNPALAETPRKTKDGSPIEWILKNPTDSVKNLIEVAQDESLMDHMIESVKENMSEKDTSCIQLLMCKMAPFVWKMQRTLLNLKLKFENRTQNYENKNNESIDKSNETNEAKIIVNNNNNNEGNDVRNDDALFRYLPEVREFIEHGEMCENKYDECRLID